MLKMYRQFRFTQLIQKLNVSRANKAIFKVCLMVYFLIFFLHYQTCIIFYLAKQEMEWIPNMDFIYGGTKIYDMNPSFQYWVTMYYSAMLFSISDMVASTTAELAFTSVQMVITIIMVANVFGLIASFVAQMDEKDQKFG